MKNNHLSVAILLMGSILTGCAASTVLKRPAAKDIDALKPGLSRGLVLAELNAPVNSTAVNGESCDTFAFDKGVSAGGKAGRAIFHVGADLFTAFLWEIVAWPAERIAARNNTTMQICYDDKENIKTVNRAK